MQLLLKQLGVNILSKLKLRELEVRIFRVMIILILLLVE